MPIYTECLTDTAARIIEKIEGATGLVGGKNLTQYHMTAQLPAASLSISGGQTDDIPGCAVTTLRMTATIEGRFKTVADAQRFAMEVCSIFPVRNAGPIESFHLSSPPTFETRMERLANQEREAMVYRVTIPAEVAFTVANG
jgi:hypothetical protein